MNRPHGKRSFFPAGAEGDVAEAGEEDEDEVEGVGVDADSQTPWLWKFSNDWDQKRFLKEHHIKLTIVKDSLSFITSMMQKKKDLKLEFRETLK